MCSLFSLSHRTLRVRLTAWYVLLLGLTLILFSTYLYFQVEHSLLERMDSNLQVAASESLVHLEQESSRPTFVNTQSYQETAHCLSRTGFSVRLTSVNGTVWDGFGGYAVVPMRVPRTPGLVTLTKDETHWRIYSQRLEMPKGRLIGWLQATQSLGELHETLESLVIQMLLALPLVLGLAGCGGLFLANRALHPIGNITSTVRAISATNLNRRMGYRGPADEVGRLAITFDQMLDRLQAAFERERRFTADASHELRTPLTIMKSRIGVTLNRPRERTEYENTLQVVERAVDRLIRLTNDMLFLARLDQGRLDWQPERLDLSNLLEAIVDQVRPLATMHNISLVEDIPSNLFIQGEPDQLISLFLNLLDNAIKYTPTAGEVTVQAECQGASVNVAVSDTGPGVPPEHLPHLFERFYRVETARTRSTGGAGLGLAIADEIVRLHSGTLLVQSAPNQGTTFTVCLPSQPPFSRRSSAMKPEGA